MAGQGADDDSWQAGRGWGGWSASDFGPRVTNNEDINDDFLRLAVPALSTEGVAIYIGGGDARPGAVADFTPDQRVAAKRLGLTLGALREHGPRRADAVAGHWFT